MSGGVFFFLVFQKRLYFLYLVFSFEKLICCTNEEGYKEPFVDGNSKSKTSLRMAIFIALASALKIASIL